MPDQRDDFDAMYRQSADYFGGRPEEILVAHIGAVDRSRRALDVGAGQGRNAFYLAKHGIRVDAIDPSSEAVDAIDAEARRSGLPVRATKTGVAQFDPGEGFVSYGAVCLFGIVQILKWKSIDVLCERVASWSAVGTLIFVTAFTTEDLSFESCSKSWRAVGKNSFADTEGAIRTFLEPGEAPRLFPKFEIVHHWEGLGPEHRHGDGPIQRHGMVEVVMSKRA